MSTEMPENPYIAKNTISGLGNSVANNQGSSWSLKVLKSA